MLTRQTVDDVQSYGDPLKVKLILLNLNQMSPTRPSNRRELGQFKFWKNPLHLSPKVLPPNTLEIIES